MKTTFLLVPGSSVLIASLSPVTAQAQARGLDPISQPAPEIAATRQLHRRVYIRPLQEAVAEGNAVAIIQLPPGDIAPPQLSVEENASRTVTFRDDGRGGDAKAGDLRYSAIVPFDFKKASDEQTLASKAKGEELKSDIWFLRSRVGLSPVPKIEVQGDEEIEILPSNLRTLNDDEKTWTHSLMITATGVVDDARARDGGKWSFGYLMTKLAQSHGHDPQWFVRRWLKNWERSQMVNFDEVPSKVGIENFVKNWPRVNNEAEGPLDLARSPFRLLAVVHRIDLRGDPLVGGEGSAGENRMVFCAVGPGGEPLQFTVIFEFGIRAGNLEAVRQEAIKWNQLKTWNVGDSIYNDELEKLTEEFVNPAPNQADPNRLDQLRTNEIALGGGWELREFRIAATGSADAGHLAQVTLKQNPVSTLDAKEPLLTWINANKASILLSRAVVPLDIGTTPVLAGRIDEPGPVWNQGSLSGPGLELRHAFSVQTCNGCHNAETGNTGFFHIFPRAKDVPATLSGFMTGILAPDPAAPTRTNAFDERSRRLRDFDVVISSNLFIRLTSAPLKMTH